PGAFSRFERLVAMRYLRSRRKDAFVSVISALTLAGIAIGVATLIVVMSVMSGFRAELLEKILGLNGHFTAFPLDERLTDYDAVVARIETVDGVVSAIPYVEGQALASGVGQSTGVSVRGMDFAAIRKLPALLQAPVLGGWDQWDQSGGVAIGHRLARTLGLSIGDPITIITPEGAVTPFGRTPQVRSYPVNVVLDMGMVEFDSLFVFMPIQTAQDYFRLYEDHLKKGVAPITLDPLDFDALDRDFSEDYERVYEATTIEVFLEDPDATETLRRPIIAAAERPLIFYSWQQRNQTFFEALQVERVVMFTILSMIIVVAAFNIISSLVMLVKDKGTDIAVLRTMGATRSSIMRIFCLAGTTIGFAGTAIGLVLGLVIAANAEALRSWVSEVIGVTLFPPDVFFLSALPSKIDPVEVAFVSVLALGLSFLATLYPAWRAAQYDPVEALRYG
ncbi:MAG TPA: ABC transporter permease, partial [Devosiaceae bacterium]|nr:ABC transporter permease [Devosiaceae bacterium]